MQQVIILTLYRMIEEVEGMEQTLYEKKEGLRKARVSRQTKKRALATIDTLKSRVKTLAG